MKSLGCNVKELRPHSVSKKDGGKNHWAREQDGTRSTADHLLTIRRGRRENVQMIGWPEGTEGRNPVKILEILEMLPAPWHSNWDQTSDSNPSSSHSIGPLTNRRCWTLQDAASTGICEDFGYVDGFRTLTPRKNSPFSQILTKFRSFLFTNSPLATSLSHILYSATERHAPYVQCIGEGINEGASII